MGKSRPQPQLTAMVAPESSGDLAQSATPGGSDGGGVQLRRELGLWSAVSLIVGVMIGSGIFVSPTSALERSGSVGLCLVVWAVCGGISLLGALAFAELGAVVPRSGAEYAYFIEAFGKLHPFWGPLPSFVCAWVYVMVLRPAEVAVIILTFSQYVCQPFEEAFMVQMDKGTREIMLKLIALVALGLMTYINIVSVKLYVRVQNVFTACKLVACFVIICGGLYALIIGQTQNLSKGFEGSSTNPRDIALAFYSGLWAYDGWSTVTSVTEEVKKPERNILWSIAIGVPVVTVVYCFMNLSYMTVLTIPEMIAAPAVAVEFGDRMLGVFKFIIPLGVALSTFGCALSIQFGVTRLCFVAAQEGHMMSALSFIHFRRLTPAPAVTLQGILTAFFILAGDIVDLIDFSSFLIWIFYGGAMVALLVLRKSRPKAHRPYKVPILIPLLVICVAVFLAVVPIAMDPSPKYLIALFFILTGVMVYIPFVYYKKHPKCLGRFTECIQKLMEVVPTDNNTG